MLLSKTISTLISSSVSSAEERKKQVRITTPNSFIPGPCLRNKGAVPLFCQQCLRRLPTDNVADGGGDGGGGDNDGDDGDDGGGGNVGDDGDDGGGGNVGDGAAADDKDCLHSPRPREWVRVTGRHTPLQWDQEGLSNSKLHQQEGPKQVLHVALV